ncbi:MAG: hypothetical protein HC902_07940 [Calothrix sp. SM1_5_4]|nr:hypothetical protein [Calothrix sp. SM1_5_4]
MPSLFSTADAPVESHKRLYIRSESVKSGEILLEIPVRRDSRDHRSLEMLAHYLNTAAPGGLLHALQSELGWITGGGFLTTVFENRVHFRFYYELTNEGMARGEDVNAMFFAALKATREYGPSEEFLAAKKTDLLKDFIRAGFSVDSFMDIYGQILASGKDVGTQVNEMLGTRTIDLRHAAGLLRPDMALYTEMGPEIPDMEFHPVYPREFKLLDNRAALKRYEDALNSPPPRKFRPELRAVDLGPAPSTPIEKMFAQSRPLPHLRERLTLDLRTDLPDTAAEIRLETAARTPRSRVAWEILLTAFFDRFRGETTHLEMYYHVRIAATGDGNHLLLSSSGDDAYASRALAWLAERLAEFQPSALEFARAKESFIASHRQEASSEFSAMAAVNETWADLDPLAYTHAQAVEIAENLDAGTTYALWREAIARSRKSYTMVGALPPRTWTCSAARPGV